MDKQERERLRELAKEAIDSTESGDYEWYSSDEVNASGADAAYINAMMPKQTVALLDHIDALEAALEEIANPIKFWKEHLKEDEELDVKMALHMAELPSTYQEIAKAALTQAEEKK